MNIETQEFAYTPTTGVRRVHETPVVEATNETLQGYGYVVEDPADLVADPG